jgi:hypothetical protein
MFAAEFKHLETIKPYEARTLGMCPLQATDVFPKNDDAVIQAVFIWTKRLNDTHAYSCDRDCWPFGVVPVCPLNYSSGICCVRLALCVIMVHV